MISEVIAPERIEVLFEAHRKGDEAEAERLEAEFIAEIKDKLETLEVETADVSEREQEKPKGDSAKKRYDTMITLYRQATSLAETLSKMKKASREARA